jgi:hypothetical protein
VNAEEERKVYARFSRAENFNELDMVVQERWFGSHSLVSTFIRGGFRSRRLATIESKAVQVGSTHPLL